MDENFAANFHISFEQFLTSISPCGSSCFLHLPGVEIGVGVGVGDTVDYGKVASPTLTVFYVH